ncbi:MAG: outer membrane beta-barrel protein [Ferruginibacter sp.]
MKAVLITGLLLGGLHAKAQHKESWSLHIAAGLSSNSSPLFKTAKNSNGNAGGTGITLLDTLGFTMFRAEGYQDVQNKVNYEAKTGSSFSAGAQYSFPVYRKWSVGIGVNFALTRLNRVSRNESVKFRNINTILRLDTVFINNGNTLTYLGTIPKFDALPTRNESFSFVTFDMPVTVEYRIKKINLAAGINTSFLVSSVKKKPEEQRDPEISYEEPAYINNKRMALSAVISPSYQLTPHIQVGIICQQGLTSLNDAQNYRPILARTASISFAYKL